MCYVELCYCNIRIRTTSKWIWWSLKHAVCVFWMVENQMVSVILIEKSNIREDGFFIPIPLFFLWLTCSIASAEIFISIYWESFGRLTSKSQLDFEIFIFVPLFCVMMVYWKRKDEDGSWKSITISWQNQDLFLRSTLGKNPKKNLITQIALPNPQFTEYQTEFTNCVSKSHFQMQLWEKQIYPSPTFQFYL